MALGYILSLYSISGEQPPEERLMRRDVDSTCICFSIVWASGGERILPRQDQLINLMLQDCDFYFDIQRHMI